MIVHAVFDHHVPQISPVEEFHIDIWVELPHAPQFAVLSRDELRTQCRQLYVEVLLHQIEVRREGFSYIPVIVPLEGKGAWLILPFDTIVVEDMGEFFFERVGK